MDLADLKAENAAEETAELEEVAEVEETEEVEEVEELTETDETEDAAETSEDTPLWMQEEEADDQTSAEQVPLSALMKQKHKGKEKDAEIEDLKRQLAERQPVTQSQQPAERPKMPRAEDFGSDEEHAAAMEQFHYDATAFNASASSNTLAAQQQETARIQARNAAIEGFIERADAVIVKHKINPETYTGALDNVRAVIEGAQLKWVKPFDEFLSKLEEGDETTLYQIGRNKGQQEKLSALLRDDPTGIKAFRHIARLTERNLGAKNKPSQASKPAKTVRGDKTASTSKEGAWQKKYDKAKPGQDQYDVRRAAKAAGVALT